MIGRTIFFHMWKVVSAFWLADIFLPKKFNTCSQANVNMESDFVNLGAVHMSRASPVNRADSILLRPMVA